MTTPGREGNIPTPPHSKEEAKGQGWGDVLGWLTPFICKLPPYCHLLEVWPGLRSQGS